MRLPLFGRAIRRNRKLAGMGVQDLTRCLTEGDHTVTALAEATSPVRVLQRLERSGTWPFDDDVLKDFIEQCARCLADGDMAREEAVRFELGWRAIHDLIMES